MILSSQAANQGESTRWPWKKKTSTRTLAVIGVVIVALIVLRAMLPELLRDHINEHLADLNAYRGHVVDVDLHLWRGAVSLHELTVEMIEEDVPVPFLDIDSLETTLSWSDLWQGAIVAEIRFMQPVLNFVDTRYERDQTGEGTDWRQALQQLVPISINHIDVVDGRIHFRNFISDPPVDLELSEINASVVNLTNIDRTESPQYADLNAEALLVNQAPVVLSARVDPLGNLHDFDIRLRIDDFDLTRLNSLARAYGNFDFQSGSGSLVMELQAERAQLSGYVKPLLDDVEILDLEETLETDGVLAALWESMLAGLSWVFRNWPEDRIGAQIDIRGNLDQQDVSTWQAFVSILRNAFVEAYEESFERE